MRCSALTLISASHSSIVIKPGTGVGARLQGAASEAVTNESCEDITDASRVRVSRIRSFASDILRNSAIMSICGGCWVTELVVMIGRFVKVTVVI